MPTILIVILLVILLGGGGGYWAHQNYGANGGLGVVGLILVIMLLLYLFGGLRIR